MVDPKHTQTHFLCLFMYASQLQVQAWRRKIGKENFFQIGRALLPRVILMAEAGQEREERGATVYLHLHAGCMWPRALLLHVLLRQPSRPSSRDCSASAWSSRTAKAEHGRRLAFAPVDLPAKQRSHHTVDDGTTVYLSFQKFFCAMQSKD